MKQPADRVFQFWNSKFSEEGCLWGELPAESASLAASLFKTEGLKNILIPGFGYGRNASAFLTNDFSVTGIELSTAAISLAREKGFKNTIHCGSVLNMPFDDQMFDGIYCYALLHLFTPEEIHRFLQKCSNQLRKGGLAYFVVISRKSDLYGRGLKVTKNRYELFPGISVYFYDKQRLTKDFSLFFDLVDSGEIGEPIKFKDGEEPLPCLYVIGRK